MKLNMYTFLDSAAAAFTTPFFMHNDGLAIRAFQDNINAKEENNMSQHPDQFTLFKVATWDDKAAKLEPLEAPQRIALGVELINDDKPRYSNTDLVELSESMKDVQTMLKEFHKMRIDAFREEQEYTEQQIKEQVG